MANISVEKHEFPTSSIGTVRHVLSEIILIKRSIAIVTDKTLQENETELIYQTEYSSELTINSQTYGNDQCKSLYYYYEVVQVIVDTVGFYTFSSTGNIIPYRYLYEDYFNPFNPSDSLLLKDDERCDRDRFELFNYLQPNVTYLLVATIPFSKITGSFSIIASGANNVTFKRINDSTVTESIYSSVLTVNSQMYSRECGKSNYYYETIEVNVSKVGNYSFGSYGINNTYGYIYNNSFNPFNPAENLIFDDGFGCDNYKFHLKVYIQPNITYILVVTTFYPNVKGNFSVHVTGPGSVILNRIIKNYSTCSVGDWCHSYTKSIGFTLDDILREEIQPNIPLHKQSLLVKISTVLTTIIFVGGLINSLFSLLTFQNKDLRKIGCGMYLFASSFTSLLTISMFTVKFWFVVLTEMKISISLSVFQVCCMSIESLLKICSYLDAWLNAFVALDRTVAVSRGVKFDKKMSKRIARVIIIILPVFIMSTIIHEPIHRDLFKYHTQKYKSDDFNIWVNESDEYENWINKSNEVEISTNDSRAYVIETHIWCVTRYSVSVQTYNTFILFFHLIVPFVANLFSALYIIFGVARQRSLIQPEQSYKKHIIEQLHKHRQLIISPVILLILTLPRLVISLLSGCMKASSRPWLYLFAYFISFTPSMLVFVVFVIPSKLYRKTFRQTITKLWRR
ncbi:unnamed protein product [Adineta steineri]|uniref:G-protein coupled receptors family 1 profile domain-containing protein n=1 Tax=Adineta steineri TaxID=433720 RepID=A0A814WCK3_9BILA|nr:unnamed protein product [Adineta steineri]